MSELLFPIFGTVVVLGLLLPASALAGALLLRLLDRWEGGAVGRWGSARYLLLVVPALLPLAWSISAGLHQAETGRSVVACLLSHDLHEICAEPLLFAALLALFVVWQGFGCISSLPRLRAGERVSGPEAARVDALIDAHPALSSLKGRVAVVREGVVGGSATLGLFRPTVVVDRDFVRRCDDETLVGALAHELGHVKALDPLRYLVLALSLRLNPLGRSLLGRQAAAWIYGRELQCDRAAVLSGAVPFGVARALLAAARPPHPAVAHIRGGSSGKLRLRVELLLSYAEQRPANDVARGSWALALAALIALLAVTDPHVGGTHPLDVLHTGVERLAGELLR